MERCSLDDDDDDDDDDEIRTITYVRAYGCLLARDSTVDAVIPCYHNY